MRIALGQQLGSNCFVKGLRRRDWEQFHGGGPFGLAWGSLGGWATPLCGGMQIRVCRKMVLQCPTFTRDHLSGVAPWGPSMLPDLLQEQGLKASGALGERSVVSSYTTLLIDWLAKGYDPNEHGKSGSLLQRILSNDPPARPKIPVVAVVVGVPLCAFCAAVESVVRLPMCIGGGCCCACAPFFRQIRAISGTPAPHPPPSDSSKRGRCPVGLPRTVALGEAT